MSRGAPLLALGLSVGAPATEQLEHVIANAMAPAFLLGAVAGFVSVLIGLTELDRHG